MTSPSTFEESLLADLIAEHEKDARTHRNRFLPDCVTDECACLVLRKVLLERLMGSYEPVPKRSQSRGVRFSYEHHCDRH